MKRIAIKTEFKPYEINIQDEYVEFVKNDLREIAQPNGVINIKDLLIAFIKKSIEEKQNQKEIEGIKEKISKSFGEN